MESREDYYTLSLPPCEGTAPPSPETVTVDSLRAIRDHVERFARYFLKERGKGGLQFEAAETSESEGYVKYEAHLFNDGHRYIGACCFRWREFKDAPASWFMDWMWLHPYFRSRGHLTRAWPLFTTRYGDFHCATPLSHSMKAFLAKVESSRRC